MHMTINYSPLRAPVRKTASPALFSLFPYCPAMAAAQPDVRPRHPEKVCAPLNRCTRAVLNCSIEPYHAQAHDVTCARYHSPPPLERPNVKCTVSHL